MSASELAYAELVEMSLLHTIDDGHHNAWRAMRVKLTCGCWSDWWHVCSPVWDDPDTEHLCLDHGQRQINISVQALLMDEQRS